MQRAVLGRGEPTWLRRLGAALRMLQALVTNGGRSRAELKQASALYLHRHHEHALLGMLVSAVRERQDSAAQQPAGRDAHEQQSAHSMSLPHAAPAALCHKAATPHLCASSREGPLRPSEAREDGK